MKCPVCRGKGEVYSANNNKGKKVCPKCFGKGFVKMEKLNSSFISRR